MVRIGQGVRSRMRYAEYVVGLWCRDDDSSECCPEA